MSILSVITLGVADLPRSIAFYENALGLKRIPFDSDAVAFFDLKGPQLSLYSREALAEDAGVSPKGEGFAAITFACNLQSSSAVDAQLQKAVDAGGTLVKPGQPVFWGGYSGYFADPDGHLWEIACGSAEYALENKDKSKK